jgi:hypothetical protein
MWAELLTLPFTERDEEGELLVSIYVTVHQNGIHIGYSTPEYHAEFSVDNFVGMQIAEAYSHPALVARFIEQSMGDGEVKCHFIRRSDEIMRLLESEQDENGQSGKKG